MESARSATTPPRTPSIPGWTVYSGPEWWEARCDADPSLIVRHARPDRLAAACAAITRPPPDRITAKSQYGPGGGFV
jgi:hypothetical protein